MSATTDDEGATACTRWDASGCTGTPYCPPRCPWFVDKHGRSLLVRPYEPDDWEALNQMYRDYDPYSRSMGLPPVKAEQIATWLRHLVDNGANFVAADGDRVVGHATYAPRDRPEPELAVYVHQDSHGRGIGTELVKHVIADAADTDHTGIVLTVEPGNKRAIHVYHKLGFEKVPADGSELKMRLSLDHPIATSTRLAPGARAD